MQTVNSTLAPCTLQAAEDLLAADLAGFFTLPASPYRTPIERGRATYAPESKGSQLQKPAFPEQRL